MIDDTSMDAIWWYMLWDVHSSCFQYIQYLKELNCLATTCRGECPSILFTRLTLWSIDIDIDHWYANSIFIKYSFNLLIILMFFFCSVPQLWIFFRHRFIWAKFLFAFDIVLFLSTQKNSNNCYFLFLSKHYSQSSRRSLRPPSLVLPARRVSVHQGSAFTETLRRGSWDRWGRCWDVCVLLSKNYHIPSVPEHTQENILNIQERNTHKKTELTEHTWRDLHVPTDLRTYVHTYVT